MQGFEKRFPADPAARLERKGPGKEARLGYAGHLQRVPWSALVRESGVAEEKIRAAASLAAAQTPAQGRADWVASATSSGGGQHAIDHYVYTTVYRFNPSPIATSGSLAAGAVVPVTLTAKDGLNHGVANSNVYLSFKAAPGGGSAKVGSTTLTSSPAHFTADSTGTVQITYTAPLSLPSTGQDTIAVQDLPTSPQGKNSASYSFAASTPVISVGDVTVYEGDQNPGTPAQFTVTSGPLARSLAR